MQRQVEDFHTATGGFGTISTPEGRALRAKLIMEEAVETVAALGFAASAELFAPPEGALFHYDQDFTVAEFSKYHDSYDEEAYVDGLCDLLYVTFGGAVNMGPVFDIEPHFDAVHAANMTKLTGPKREDGKQLKPEGWQPPDHESLFIRWRNKIEEWSRYLHGEQVAGEAYVDWLQNRERVRLAESEAQARHERLLNGEQVA